MSTCFKFALSLCLLFAFFASDRAANGQGLSPKSPLPESESLLRYEEQRCYSELSKLDDINTRVQTIGERIQQSKNELGAFWKSIFGSRSVSQVPVDITIIEVLENYRARIKAQDGEFPYLDNSELDLLENQADSLLNYSDVFESEIIRELILDRVLPRNRMHGIEFIHDLRLQMAEKIDASLPKSKFELSAPVVDTLRDLSVRRLEEGRMSFRSVVQGEDPAEVYISWLDERIPQLKKARLGIDAEELKGVFRSALDKLTTLQQSAIKMNGELAKQWKDRLRTIGEKIAKIEASREGIVGTEGTQSSTIYMIVLLAFTFALAVIARAMKDDLPLITDSTLIEFGGMSFLILAIIILASAGRVESNTVGPLLGTIAGYIFGKNMGRQQASPESSLQAQRVTQAGTDAVKKKVVTKKKKKTRSNTKPASE